MVFPWRPDWYGLQTPTAYQTRQSGWVQCEKRSCCVPLGPAAWPGRRDAASASSALSTPSWAVGAGVVALSRVGKFGPVKALLRPQVLPWPLDPCCWNVQKKNINASINKQKHTHTHIVTDLALIWSKPFMCLDHINAGSVHMCIYAAEMCGKKMKQEN